MKKIILTVFTCFIVASLILPNIVLAHLAVLTEKSCHYARGQGRHCHSVWKNVPVRAGQGFVERGTEADLQRSISLAQKYLTRLGYYTGEIDGVVMESTINAVKQYQKDNGKTVDGKITRPLLVNLAVSVSDISDNSSSVKK